MEYILFIAIAVFVLYIIYFLIPNDSAPSNLSLEKNGIQRIGTLETKEDVLAQLPNGYEFISYRYRIKGDGVSTFHRDVTSSPYEFNTNYPVYTLIQYTQKGEHISTCLGSHLHTPFTWSRPTNFRGESGTYYLFHCDLVHAGAVNILRNPNREIVQYKLCHREDLNTLNHLVGVDYYKQYEPSQIGFLTYLKRYLSLLLCVWINHVATPILQKETKWIKWLVGNVYYNKDSA